MSEQADPGNGEERKDGVTVTTTDGGETVVVEFKDGREPTYSHDPRGDRWQTLPNHPPVSTPVQGKAATVITGNEGWEEDYMDDPDSISEGVYIGGPK